MRQEDARVHGTGGTTEWVVGLLLAIVLLAGIPAQVGAQDLSAPMYDRPYLLPEAVPSWFNGYPTSFRGSNLWAGDWTHAALRVGSRYHLGYWRERNRRLATGVVQPYLELGLWDSVRVQASTYLDHDTERLLASKVIADGRLDVGEDRFASLHLGISYSHWREGLWAAEGADPDDGWPRHDESEVYVRYELLPEPDSRMIVFPAFTFYQRLQSGRRFGIDIYRLRPAIFGLDALAEDPREDVGYGELRDLRSVLDFIDTWLILLPRAVTWVKEADIPGNPSNNAYWMFSWQAEVALTTGSRVVFPGFRGPNRPDGDVSREFPLGRLTLGVTAQYTTVVSGSLEDGWSVMLDLNWIWQ